MNILVLGAGGFIGSHLVEHLVTRGEHEVVGVDVSDDKLAGIAGKGFTFHSFDVRGDPHFLSQLIGEADVVVDLIAYANPSLYVSSPLRVFELNFTQNLRVAELCIKHGKWLVQYSSAEVYGKATQGGRFEEDTSDLVMGPVSKQRWIYATSKVLLERVLHAHGLKGDLKYTIVRPFNFIGSRIDYLVTPGSTGGPRVFAHFLSALMNDGPMQIVDGGHVHRTFLHIEDANAGFQALLDHPEQARNQIFNMGNPANNITIRELAHLMRGLFQELTGRKAQSEVVEVTGEEFYGEGYDDGDRLPPAIDKLRALGWAPKRGIETTFRDAMGSHLVPSHR